MKQGNNITKTGLKQLQHENNTWKRLLEFLMQENVFLKNRLAEVIRESPDSSDLIEAAEQYQNAFIHEDEIIRMVRHDVAEFNKLLIRDVYENGVLIKEILRKHKKLKQELVKIEKEFNKLKTTFNSFLSGVL